MHSRNRNIFSKTHAIVILKKLIISFFKCLFIFERERDRQTMSRGGAERDGDTESEAGIRL